MAICATCCIWLFTNQVKYTGPLQLIWIACCLQFIFAVVNIYDRLAVWDGHPPHMVALMTRTANRIDRRLYLSSKGSVMACLSIYCTSHLSVSLHEGRGKFKNPSSLAPVYPSRSHKGTIIVGKLLLSSAVLGFFSRAYLGLYKASLGLITKTCYHFFFYNNFLRL